MAVIVVGLTGSIGMGKSTTAAMFAEAGAPVYDADAEVGKIYAKGGAATEPLAAAFPGVVKDGAVDREALRQQVLGDPQAIARLNAIVHPLLGAGRAAFFDKARNDGTEIIVLDIPLLYETGGDARVDAVVVVSAPPEAQRQRVLARPGWNDERLAAILAQQWPDAEKRARADFVIDTSKGLEPAREQVRQVMAALRSPGWRRRADALSPGA
jgi:dephospho-CoA kinase